MGIGVGVFVPSPIFYGRRGLMSRYEAGVRSDGGSFAFPIDTGLASRLEGLGLLNASSLVNSCNAGKESVLYNLIPTPVQSLDRFAVTRSTVKWVLGANGVLTSIPANTPAFEYNTDGTYRGLLVEPAGTNLLLRSSEFNTTWTSSDGASVTPNTVGSPDGTTTADTIDLSSTINTRVTQPFSLANSTTYTVSCFFKNIALTSGQTFVLRINNQLVAPNNFILLATIDLFAGTATYSLTGTATTGISGVATGSIQDYGNGWYRVSVTGTTGTSAANASAQVQIIQPVGSAARSFYAWGAQLETGSVATSYIPTVASTQTRTADSVTLTGASSLIGQTEGTVYAEVNVSRLGLEGYIFRADDTSLSNFITIRKLATNEIRAVITATTSAGTVNLSSAPVTTGVVKIAYAYTSGSIAISVNGSSPTVVTGTFSFGTALSRMYLGIDISSTPWNDTVRAYALFPTRLANATLQALTA